MKASYRPMKDAVGLMPGDRAPLFTATDLFGNPYALSEALKRGPVVVIFYRGQWCPFCNRHLRALQNELPHLYDRGASVVAISPEKSEFLKQAAKKTGAEFALLFDEGYKISNAFDLTIKPGTLQKLMYNHILGARLQAAHSDASEKLPIPATFIINSDGLIIWRHFDPNYMKRSSVADILNHLP